MCKAQAHLPRAEESVHPVRAVQVVKLVQAVLPAVRLVHQALAELVQAVHQADRFLPAAVHPAVLVDPVHPVQAVQVQVVMK